MRKLTVIILTSFIICLFGYGVYRGYRAWQQQHLVAMAEEFYAKSDTKNALLSLREALAANPRNIGAARMAATVLEAGRSPESLLWRSLVVELDPKSTEDRIALAKTAMIFRDYTVATNALNGISAEGKKTAAYQNTSGSVMAAINLFPEAKQHFLQAAQLDPQNPVPQFNVAVVDIHGTNETVAEEARATLQRLSLNPTNSELRRLALRELTWDALRNGRENSALALSEELLLQTNITFADHLLRLEALKVARSDQLAPTMLALEREASTNSAKLYELAVWQRSQGQIREGLAWLQGLHGDVRTNLPAALLIAEFQVASRDWTGLQRGLDHQNWAESDFIRRAFMALAFHGQGLIDSSKSEWEQALRAAGSQRMSRLVLLRLCAQWGWRNEAEDLLWIVVNQYPDEKWAGPALAQLLFVGGRTQSLLELFNEENKAYPSDLANKNNLAMTALLLDPKETKPYTLARETYQQAPTNSFFASTYAFSLLLQRKNAEALKVMEQIKPSDLENPSIAGYYAMILDATGNHNKAKRYFKLSSAAPHLPEEQKLFNMAMARN